MILQDQGHALRRPYADYLECGIYELRAAFAGQQCRGLYFFYHRERIVITHGFTKKTNRVDPQEIEKALRFKAEFEQRAARGEMEI